MRTRLIQFNTKQRYPKMNSFHWKGIGFYLLTNQVLPLISGWKLEDITKIIQFTMKMSGDPAFSADVLAKFYLNASLALWYESLVSLIIIFFKNEPLMVVLYQWVKGCPLKPQTFRLILGVKIQSVKLKHDVTQSKLQKAKKTSNNKLTQEKMRGQRGRLKALAGICYVHESYF